MQLILIATVASAVLLPAAAAPLMLETKIPLGEVSGRIDHLAFDASRQRLYIAELGNNSVGIVDMKSHRLIRTVPGFEEPQGVGYEPTTDSIFVANGGDGSVQVFGGANFSPLGSISLGQDADNVRIDPSAHRVYVGYGSALAIIDPTSRTRIADIPLHGHPESFQLDPDGDAIYVNVPDATQIALISRESKRQLATWSTGTWRANYPLALDAQKHRVIAAFRRPAHLQGFDSRSGQMLNGIDLCADSDDVFVDAKRQRVYAICGQGYVDAIDASGDTYSPVGRFATSSGSRTGLFVPELDRLLVAIRAANGESAAIWVLRPSP